MGDTLTVQRTDKSGLHELRDCLSLRLSGERACMVERLFGERLRLRPEERDLAGPEEGDCLAGD
jgi:hypothetical protein